MACDEYGNRRPGGEDRFDVVTSGAGSFDITVEPIGDAAVGGLASGDGVVVLDVELTDELVNEGRARQLQREIQDARRERDLRITDRIELVLAAEDEVRAWLLPHVDQLASQVLAVSTTWGAVGDHAVRVELDGRPVQFSFVVAG